jgi:hypothetical protein
MMKTKGGYVLLDLSVTFGRPASWPSGQEFMTTDHEVLGSIGILP